MNDHTLAEVVVSLVTIPTEQPEADGTLSWDHTDVVIVETRTKGGVEGLGYAWGNSAVAALASDMLVDVVRGRDVRDVGGAWEAMVRAIRNFGRPGISSMAIAALDIALWDTLARCDEQPLHRVLGATRSTVDVYGSGGFTSYTTDELVAQLRGWVDAGIPRVKMKIGRDRGAAEREDLERVRAAREAIGSEVELYVDANGAYSRKQARRLGDAFTECGVSWFEEPVSSDDLDGLAQLRAALRMDISAGEYGYDSGYFRRMLEARAVDVLQADTARCAGYTEWLRAAAIAQSFQVPFSAHCGPALHLPVALVPPNVRHIEWFHDHVRIERMLFDGVPEPVGGCVSPSRRSGHGMRLKDDARTLLKRIGPQS